MRMPALSARGSRFLNVSRNGYYQHRKNRVGGPEDRDRQEMTERAQEIAESSGDIQMAIRYGQPEAGLIHRSDRDLQACQQGVPTVTEGSWHRGQHDPDG